MSEIVYVFSNPAMPGLVKIGKTNRESIDHRLKELFTTSVPLPFECEFACEVKKSKDVELALHTAFNPYKIHPKREYFRIMADQAIAILKIMSKKDITRKIRNDVNNNLTDIDKEAGKRYKIQKRPPLDFFKMGIRKGDILKHIDGEISVKVIGNRKVNYKGKITSLTAIIKKLKKLTHSIQPTKYWTYKGKNLSEIYDDTFPFIN